MINIMKLHPIPIGLVMELIKYDDLIQHRFVKNERISNILVRVIFYTATIVIYLYSINYSSSLINDDKYIANLIMILILFLLCIVDIFIEIIFYKKIT